MRVREILAATDFSDLGDAAVRVAREYAAGFDARVHLVHVAPSGELGHPELLARIARDPGPTVPIIVAATSGDPAEEIVRYARTRGIDLIVVGTHGRSGFTRLLMGSVAERVLRQAPCPVLTVPRQAEEPAVTTVAASPSTAPIAPTARCVVCANPSVDLICEPCRARIRGEALEHKQREERAGRT
jgi:nucleotide-binding universal stress UspA family protein